MSRHRASRRGIAQWSRATARIVGSEERLEVPMMPRAVELEIDDACIWFVMSLEHRFFQEQLMDTNYFQQAVDEYALKRSMQIKVGDLTMGELSWLLRRAQELKEADGKPQPVAHQIEHAEEIR
jgi:hypothetical protein